MKIFLLAVLFVGALVFSAWEKRLWGSGRTPFAFAAYPFIGVLLLVVTVGPILGFFAIHAETVVISGCFLSIMALGSLAVRAAAGDREIQHADLESAETHRTVDQRDAETPISSFEFLLVTGGMLAFFVSDLLRGSIGGAGKGELGIGGIRGHIMEIGVAYLVIAASQRRGQFVVRSALIATVLWVLAFNQVKYLIMLPLAAVILYRWVSRQLATWKLVVLILTLPLLVVVVVYAVFGLSVGLANAQIMLPLVVELANHMMAYVFGGVIGLDQMLAHTHIAILGAGGLEYAFAPLINTAHFIVGNNEYVNAVNSTYFIIHSDGFLDSNVFTLFGSLLYRGGWTVALAISAAYAILTYLIWGDWRTRSDFLTCASGSWWLSPLLFAWFDPYFTVLTLIEVYVFLLVRARIRWTFSVVALRHQSA